MMGAFVCGGCVGPVAGAGRAGVDVGGSAGLELVDGFCCLGGMMGVNRHAGAAVGGRSSNWSEFRQLVLLLASRDVSFVVGGRLCIS